jgi:cytoskeletal protein CcmA (bactofilin family)
MMGLISTEPAMGFMQGKSVNDIGSQLSEGVELSGEFNFDKGVRIGGTVKGKIKANATLEIGPTGKIDADVEVRRISIQGELRGTVHASERVEIHKEGKVYGEIYTPCLIIESGAFFEGRCNMGDGAKADGATGTKDAKAETKAKK